VDSHRSPVFGLGCELRRSGDIATSVADRQRIALKFVDPFRDPGPNCPAGESLVDLLWALCRIEPIFDLNPDVTWANCDELIALEGVWDDPPVFDSTGPTCRVEFSNFPRPLKLFCGSRVRGAE
jgi:hypothetical protein